MSRLLWVNISSAFLVLIASRPVVLLLLLLLLLLMVLCDSRMTQAKPPRTSALSRHGHYILNESYGCQRERFPLSLSPAGVPL
uniref:Secreted protein n=1 Tax=Anopheles darlingi TaxID=43151 RepID=A0A2M4DHH6_ANODA